MGDNPMRPEWKRRALERLAIGIVLNRRRLTRSLIETNIRLFAACKQLKEVNHLDLELPYYWGEFGVHVVYKEFTDAIKVNLKDPEDERFVMLGDIDPIDPKRDRPAYCGGCTFSRVATSLPQRRL